MVEQDPSSRSRVDVTSRSGVVSDLLDVDLRFLTHPLVASVYAVVIPLLPVVVLGPIWEATFADATGALLTAVAMVFWGRLSERRTTRPVETGREIAVRILATVALVTLGTSVSVVLWSDRADLTAEDSTNPGVVLAATLITAAAMVVQHVFTWFLLVVLVGGSLAYRRERRATAKLMEELTGRPDDSPPMPSLTDEQRESVAQVENRMRELEELLHHETNGPEELSRSVRDLRQNVVAPILTRLNELLNREEAAPALGKPDPHLLAQVPWRWSGHYFSGTVGALLIGVVGLLTLAPSGYYYLGNFIQLPLLLIAFFLSVPAALILFFTAALSPFVTPGVEASGNIGFFIIIVVLAIISFLQRFNRVRQVRAVETARVATVSQAVANARHRAEMRSLHDHVYSLLHGSVQSTLLALELGLQSGSPSARESSEKAIRQLRDLLAGWSTGNHPSPVEITQALDEIVAVWAAGITVHVDISPDAADALSRDQVAVAAVIEVVKEGTSNAAKHSSSNAVNVVVNRDDHLLRVKVQHPSGSARISGVSTGLGLRYLSDITSQLRLVDDGTTTTLYAEIPS